MKSHTDAFTQRQTMNTRFFEFHHYVDLEPPEVAFHEHEFYEVFFFLSGNVDYVVEGRTYQLRPGDILLTNNRDIHRPEVRPGRPYERYVLWLETDFFQRLEDFGDDLSACFNDAARKKYKLIRPSGDSLAHLQRLCTYMAKIQEEELFGSHVLMYACLVEFLVYLNRAYFETPDEIRLDITENPKINQILLYIEEHLSDELSLDGLAQQFHMSKFYLNNKFKQYAGLTLYQYIMKKRLTIARNMLRSGTPVMEACMRCGFSDYSNFLKAFKREFGRMPREYIAGR